MDPDTLYPLLVTSVVIIVGWLVTHYFTTQRDLKNKKRELRVQYLLKAYRRLEAVMWRGDETKESVAEIESALSDIQLLGTRSQVEKVKEIAKMYEAGKEPDYIYLMMDLRNSLRRELELKPVENIIMHLRFIQDQINPEKFSISAYTANLKKEGLNKNKILP